MINSIGLGRMDVYAWLFGMGWNMVCMSDWCMSVYTSDTCNIIFCS